MFFTDGCKHGKLYNSVAALLLCREFFFQFVKNSRYLEDRLAHACMTNMTIEVIEKFMRSHVMLIKKVYIFKLYYFWPLKCIFVNPKSELKSIA
jgi:hypothetical protein